MSTTPAAVLSFRLSIRWIPDEASEPTNTVALTGAKNGVFLDTRFFKGTKNLDWAFAGYRTTDPNEPKVIRFRHDIDSRTLDQVEDSGTNTTLPDGTTLEVGEMINPQTGKMTPFEEIWRDEEETNGKTVLFIRNLSRTVWQARAGKWQLALGREENGNFWAWQGENVEGSGWVVRSSTTGVSKERLKWLPEHHEMTDWVEGLGCTWQEERWTVLEKGG